MATHFIGYYYVREHGHLVIIRRMTLPLHTDEVTELSMAGQKDPSYISLEDPEVGVIIGEKPEASYEMGFQLSVGHTYHESIDVSGMYLYGTCSECNGPLRSYTDMLVSGDFRCPHCERLLMKVRSNPFNDIACALAIEGEKLDDKTPIRPPFELPFGFPLPSPLVADDSLILANLVRVTEHENLEKGLGVYVDALDKA